MQEPTRPGYGEGRRWWNRTREQNSIRPAGVLATACKQSGPYATREVPSGDRGTDQLAARERKAGPYGMAERLVVPTKPGNSGRGKRPQLKADARSDDRKGDWRKPDNSQVVFRSCRQRHMRWLRRLRESSPRAGCGKSARPVR